MSFLVAGPANAAVLFTTGAMTEIAAPPSFASGAVESSSTIFILDEGTKILPADVFVDAFGPGPQAPDGPLTTIPMGLLVNTYFAHFDPDGGVVSLTGTVFFDPGETIVGITLHTPYTSATDGFPIGHPTPIYPSGDADRGFETLPGVDGAVIAGDLGSVSFEVFAELGIDQARIFTVTIPEPSPVGLLAMAAAILALRRRSRSNR